VAIVDVANRALSLAGTRSSISSLSETSNEAYEVNKWFNSTRDELLRMAPWNCATNYNNISVLKAAPGTPENPNNSPVSWNKSIPPPPWAYEYGFPTDCLRPLFIVPQFMTGFNSGVPITTAVTGGVPSYWNGPPVRFKVAIDQDADGNDIKVILTNQQQAILVYIKQVQDPSVWDALFSHGMESILAARLCVALTGDKALANMRLATANEAIKQARAVDGNEGLTINDITPDWIRIRGIDFPIWENSPNMQIEWGPLFTPY
jgi:hypothetical protein